MTTAPAKISILHNSTTAPFDITSKLNKRLDDVRQDFVELLQKIHKENTRSQNALRSKLEQDEKEFELRQKEEALQFEKKQKEDKKLFLEGQKRQVFRHQQETAKRLREREDFIKNIKPKNKPEDRLERENEKIEIMKLLECRVCFNQMAPPIYIWQCPQGHPVCGTCYHKIPSLQDRNVKPCPTCRQDIVGRANTLEKIAMVFKNPDMSFQSDNHQSKIRRVEGQQTARRFDVGTSEDTGRVEGQQIARRFDVGTSEDTDFRTITILDC